MTHKIHFSNSNTVDDYCGPNMSMDDILGEDNNTVLNSTSYRKIAIAHNQESLKLLGAVVKTEIDVIDVNKREMEGVNDDLDEAPLFRVNFGDTIVSIVMYHKYRPTTENKIYLLTGILKELNSVLGDYRKIPMLRAMMARLLYLRTQLKGNVESKIG